MYDQRWGTASPYRIVRLLVLADLYMYSSIDPAEIAYLQTKPIESCPSL